VPGRKLAKGLDGYSLQRKIRAVGWTFFCLAGDLRATFFRATNDSWLRTSIKRILKNPTTTRLNSPEITRVDSKQFLGFPRAGANTRWRRIQQCMILCQELQREFGGAAYDRLEAPATPEQKELLAKPPAQQVKIPELEGEEILAVLTDARGNGASIGGLKIVRAAGWFAMRPSGTENIHKLYGESFRGADHLRRILEEAQTIVKDALAAVKPPATLEERA
jgi:hypothetical protein